MNGVRVECGREGCAQVMRTNPYASDGVVDTVSATWPVGRGFESHRSYKVWKVLWLPPSPPSRLVSYSCDSERHMVMCHLFCQIVSVRTTVVRPR